MVQRFFKNMYKTEILEKLSKLLEGITGETEINFEHPIDDKFGDYSTNVAMIMAKKLKRNPKEIASEVKDGFVKQAMTNDSEMTGIIDKVEVAGNGFINFYLTNEYLINQTEKINYEIELRKTLSMQGEGKTMVIDYSAPNIAKPFGIGHLRSTNIGQAIYNIYKILGWNCIGDNHIGDWGTQYGKLVAAIKKWNEKDISDLTIENLEKLYVRFHKEAETDEKLIDEGRDWFAKLENGDKEAREIWQKCVDISLLEFDKVYEMLGVKIDQCLGESFYQDKMDKVLKAMIKKGILIESQGAKIVEFLNMPPAMVQKSNGTTTYFTRDMATVKYRLDTWNPDLIIYEVGSDQILHFRQVFETAKKMDWMPKIGFVHVAHGMFRWTDGKLSTRKGQTIHLEDVIEKALEEAKKIAPDNSEEKIRAVALGAIKFNDLSQDPKKDIIFDWKRVMSMEGDSGPYLQYTYARCVSVLDKTTIVEQKNIDNDPENINPEEMALLRELSKFEEKLLESAERFSPAVWAEYLLTIARKYNEFYAKHRIIDQPEETFRIFLTKATSTALSMGLKVLGIETIEKM